MAVERLDSGSEITFGEQGEVRSVTVAPADEHVFSEHKSLRQLALDLQHEQMVRKHAPKPAENTETAPEAADAK